MQEPEKTFDISVIWRGNKFVVGMSSCSSFKDLGNELQKLTGAKADTIQLIVPKLSNKGSTMLSPFSEHYSCLTLEQVPVFDSKPVRMLGVPEDEIDKVLQNAKADLRIAGFEEEERRLRMRTSNEGSSYLKLPKGPYTFCGFRTLQIPGVKLHPPASEALKRMHMLAADPGIVAIMNKHRWRVGIMTEMAPVGYVGISPKCVLGFNKNHGDEISLRLRTDDLRGFRNYESIKKTLLHELAHMVFSEHDANFQALDKELNEEAASLDWTKSRGRTVSGVSNSKHEIELYAGDSRTFVQKLGGGTLNQLRSAPESSVEAAYHRLADPCANNRHEEPDPDDSELHEDNTSIKYVRKGTVDIQSQENAQLKNDHEPHSPDMLESGNTFLDSNRGAGGGTEEPVLDDLEAFPECDIDVSLQPMKIVDSQSIWTNSEPDPDDKEARQNNLGCRIVGRRADDVALLNSVREKPDPDEFKENAIAQAEPDPDIVPQMGMSSMIIDEPELQRIQNTVANVCSRLQKAIEMLQTEVNSAESTSVLQTLFKIVRNVIEHPDEVKFKRLRKANPIIQRNIANYGAAMEILLLIGFGEDVISDSVGKLETYLVLKRNDPGLLWLAKSSLEAYV